MRDPGGISEAISIQVGRWLIRKGYVLASCYGVASPVSFESNSLGLLSPIKIGMGSARKLFIGTLWFSNDYRTADEKNWVFEVFGEENLEEAQELAKELELAFNVKIRLYLAQENLEAETFLSLDIIDCII